jgi:hypothetical protein
VRRGQRCADWASARRRRRREKAAQERGSCDNRGNDTPHEDESMGVSRSVSTGHRPCRHLRRGKVPRGTGAAMPVDSSSREHRTGGCQPIAPGRLCSFRWTAFGPRLPACHVSCSSFASSPARPVEARRTSQTTPAINATTIRSFIMGARIARYFSAFSRSTSNASSSAIASRSLGRPAARFERMRVGRSRTARSRPKTDSRSVCGATAS